MNKGMNHIFKLTPIRLAIIVTVGMFAFYHLFAEKIELLEFLELKVLDLRFKARNVRPVSDDVVIVAIDDASIFHFGGWPWPRSVHADLIEALKDYGAKAVGFDVIFSEPQQDPSFYMLKALRQHYASLPISDEEPYGVEFGRHLDAAIQSGHDEKFTKAIKKSNNIVLPFVFQRFSDSDKESPDFAEKSPPIPPESEDWDNDEPPPELLADLPSFGEKTLVPPEVKALAFKHVTRIKGTEEFDTPIARGLSLPLAEFYMNAKYLGHPNFSLDIDGILRWADMVIACEDQYYPHFSLQLLKIFKGLDDNNIELIHGKGIQFGKTFIPLDEKGRFLINYYGPAYMFKYYSYAEVTEKKLSPEIFKDKIVIVGYAATGLFDITTTPFSEAMPGVEKHATIISNILQEDFLIRNRSVYLIDLAYILIIGLAIGFIVPRFSPLQGSAIAFGTLGIVLLSNYLLFRWLNIWVNILYPFLTLFLVSASIILFKFFTEEKDKEFLKNTFESYLSPDLISDMCNSKIMPRLGGEAKIITAYFTDIRNFSACAEILTPEQLVELLNEYLSAMTEILQNENGTLDKYEGDAIIAFFGAPVDIPDHALRACQAAVAMQNKLSELCEKWCCEKQSLDEPDRNVRNLPPEEWFPGDKWPKIVSHLKMRIGINTGEIVVGNMGSATRMNYTMMGDAVNLASRLENACKHYGVYILASGHTVNYEGGEGKKIGDMVEARFIDNVIVAGKSEPVKVYEIRAMKGGLSAPEKKLFKIFDEGMQYYLKMKWDEAIAKFDESFRIEQTMGKSAASQVYIRRCRKFKKNPPVPSGEKWDGIFRLTKK